MFVLVTAGVGPSLLTVAFTHFVQKGEQILLWGVRGRLLGLVIQMQV